jgi:tetratricopeptide (TPR) repeat protein
MTPHVFEDWEKRIEVARERGRPGDILVYADEVPTQDLRGEAYRAAGDVLLGLGQFKFALEQYEKALEADPADIDLGLRAEVLRAVLPILDQALTHLNQPWWPSRTFLFSGHMIDKPDRKEPRFPADKEPIAARAIADKLEELDAGPQDLALCGGACGGDLLFAEESLRRGMRLRLFIPLEEPEFLRKSVTCADDNWRDRFYRVKEDTLTSMLVMPHELGPTPQGMSHFARNNLWLLYTALAYGPERVRFICLWNRAEGDGPGGTQHMYESVTKHAGRVYVLDTNKLW